MRIVIIIKIIITQVSCHAHHLCHHAHHVLAHLPHLH